MKSHVQSFGERNFARAELGDKRRNKCLIRVVDEMVRRPGGTLPAKLQTSRLLKSFYRLVDCEQVTHEAIMKPHREATLEQIDELELEEVLVIHDSTELDYSTHYSLKDLGQIGNGSRKGIIAHNSLAVDPSTGHVVGLLNQVLHRRCKVSKGETLKSKRERESRESRIWLRGTEPLPQSRRFIDVCDRGADTFEFLEHECHSGRRFVIRMAYNRKIYVGHDDASDKEGYLLDHARTVPAAGYWKLSVSSKREIIKPKKKGEKKVCMRKQREANMAVSFAPVQIRPPSTRYGQYGNTPLRVWIVRVWETDPPEGNEPLEWFLITNHAVTTFEEAYRVVGWYEHRWVIEEYHKAIKTGCSIEKMQFTSEDRLHPAIALISVVALTLLTLRDAGRAPDAKKRKATEVISEDYVAILSTWRHGKPNLNWTVHDFYYALGRLGGHQNRKSDHPPGWQVLWRGWIELQAMIRGAEVASEMKKCG